jgi:hypothetical protein
VLREAQEEVVSGSATCTTATFESEIDKRKQLEVRVSAIEKHLGLDKKIAA